VPLVFNQHFTGTMDHWDRAVTDGLAQDRELILFNNADGDFYGFWSATDRCAVARRRTRHLARVVQAGVVPMDTAAVCSEIRRSWSRDDAAQWAEAYAAMFPPYQLLIESYTKAQEVVTRHEVLDSQRK
jgi:hypothetical protein